jgi:phosphoglycolate phosphatase
MKCIFLDFNGTVLDDVNLCLELLNIMLEEKENKRVGIEEYKNIFTFPIIKYYEAAGLTFNGYTFAELADWFIKEYTERNIKECHIFDDVKQFVDLVHRAGYKVILCSASKLNLLIDQLNAYGIFDYFDDVIGLDNHHAASKLQLALNYIKDHSVDTNNSYFIGDTTHDFEVGEAMGTKVILVNRGHQSNEVLSTTKTDIASTLLDAYKLISY